MLDFVRLLLLRLIHITYVGSTALMYDRYNWIDL
jgi:hypothetical protein